MAISQQNLTELCVIINSTPGYKHKGTQAGSHIDICAPCSGQHCFTTAGR